MKKFLLISSLTILVLSLASIYILRNKFDSLAIMSVNKEYNLVINPKEETIDIPLFFERYDSFLTSPKIIDSINIEGKNAKINVSSYEIEKLDKIKYQNKYYYSYIFHLSFNQYDGFNEPIKLEEAKLNISYTNNEKLSFAIGNMNILFNREIKNNNLAIYKLEGIYNTFQNKEVLVGINLKIGSLTNSEITITKISLKNDFYFIDYNYLDYSLKDVSIDILSELEGYSIISTNNETFYQDIKINKEINLFLPIRYLEILEVDRLPLYIEYEIDGETYIYIQDDFMFRSSPVLLNNNGVNKYEYNYY